MSEVNDLSDNTSMRSAEAEHIVEPPEDLNGVVELARFLERHPVTAVRLGAGAEQVPLPRPVYEMLRHVVNAMERGASVSVEPLDKQLTTQQAADLLGVSRSTVVRLLEERELPFERFGPSRHRRLRLHDVLAYRGRKRVERRSRLDELTRQAEEDGLHDVEPGSYWDVLADVRKS